MLLAVLVFLLGAGGVLGAYAAVTRLPGILAQRRLDRRLKDLALDGKDGKDNAEAETEIVKRSAESPLDRLVEGTRAGASLSRLVEQSGVRTTPGAVMVQSLGAALALALVAGALTRQWFFMPVGAALGLAAPIWLLMFRRGRRMAAFEEHFPEALDLLSRALKAGHAFQTAMGMVADEMKAPVGPEFKKTFDQQNFGLPLRDSLTQMSERVPLLDVRFFVTAVLIQRETGGNLAEILENLAHVVRERFKILRQVRVHTAHARFTAFVLLALPAGLAVALYFLSPEHMDLLFNERMGQTMLMGAIVMQVIGFVWIKKIIKIEV